MARSLALAFVLAASGCSLITTSTGLKTGNSKPVTSDGNGNTSSEPVASGNGNLVMPDLIGKTYEEAIAIGKAAGFTHEVETRMLECEDAPKVADRINCQDPEAGKVVARYSLIGVNVYKPQVFVGMLVRHQLLTLIGMSPDQAKAQLKKLGHDGTVNIDVVRSSGGGQSFMKGCGDNKICYLEPEAGIGLHDPITLYINPKLTIAPPD